MATVNERLSPAQVSDACRLYVRRMHTGKNMPVPDESILLGTSDTHFMKDDGTLADTAFDYVMISYSV